MGILNVLNNIRSMASSGQKGGSAAQAPSQPFSQGSVMQRLTSGYTPSGFATQTGNSATNNGGSNNQIPNAQPSQELEPKQKSSLVPEQNTEFIVPTKKKQKDLKVGSFSIQPEYAASKPTVDKNTDIPNVSENLKGFKDGIKDSLGLNYVEEENPNPGHYNYEKSMDYIYNPRPVGYDQLFGRDDAYTNPLGLRNQGDTPINNYIRAASLDNPKGMIAIGDDEIKEFQNRDAEADEKAKSENAISSGSIKDQMTAFLNSDDPAAKQWKLSHGMNDDTDWNWYTDLTALTMPEDNDVDLARDVWSAMLQNPDIGSKYIHDYGTDYFAGDQITDEEARNWFDTQRELNYFDDLNELNWTNQDDERIKRLFGGNDRQGGVVGVLEENGIDTSNLYNGNRAPGASNDIVDAYNMVNTLAVSEALSQGFTPEEILASGTSLVGVPDGQTFVSMIDQEKNALSNPGGPDGTDVESFENAIARVNNNMKLAQIVDFLSNNPDSRSALINLGPNNSERNRQINALLNNNAGKKSTYGIDKADGRDYVYPDSSLDLGSIDNAFNALINNGGDSTAEFNELLARHLGGAYGNQSMADLGYHAYKRE